MQKDLIKLFWNYTRPFSRLRNLALILVVFAIVAEGYIAPYILSIFIDRLQAGSVTLESSLPLIVTYGIVLFLSTVVAWRLTLWATWKFQVYSMRNLSTSILDHLAKHSLHFHANRFGGALISQSTKLVDALERFWGVVIWDLLPVVVGVLAAVTILSFVYWQYAVFLLVISVVFGIAVFYGSRFLRLLNQHEVEAWNNVTGLFADVITNISTVKSFGQEPEEHKKMQEYTKRWTEKSFGAMRGFLGVSTIWSFLLVVIYVCALVFATIAGENKTIQVGAVYLMLTYTLSVGRHLWSLNHVMRQYNNILGNAAGMAAELKLLPDIQDRSDTIMSATHGAIELKNVSFTHDNGDGEHIFKNLTLSIKPGERIGLVGRSGSGKTTFTRLLLRFSDIDSGTITIDDQDISNVTQQSLHQTVAYVAQEPILFHRSLGENIAYGKPTATRAEIIKAAKRAHAWDFISKLPDGLDTTVGERGVKLSGGQRQRIAIARALLKDSPILVLDEATSALDSESEKLIQDSLDELMKHRTSIVIAHRLSTIAKLDRIIVLDEGVIIEDGSHAQLIKGNGVYASLWKHQTGGFIEA